VATIDAEAFRHFARRGHDPSAGPDGDFLGPVTARTIEALLDAAAVGRGTRVLDVSGGPGLAAVAAARGAVVVGGDPAARTVAGARAHQPEQLPFDEASLDAVVCNFGVGHFPRPERVAAEFVRVLAGGGRTALSWWDDPARTRVSGVVVDAVAEAGVAAPAGPPPFRFSDDAELRALLTIAGLTDVTVQTLAWSHRIASADAWWEGGLGSLGGGAAASVLAQPVAVQRRIRAAFDRLVEHHRADGAFVVPVSAKIAAGRKP
jgi:SAM-dependent methyltransferase